MVSNRNSIRTFDGANGILDEKNRKKLERPVQVGYLEAPEGIDNWVLEVRTIRIFGTFPRLSRSGHG